MILDKIHYPAVPKVSVPAQVVVLKSLCMVSLIQSNTKVDTAS